MEKLTEEQQALLNDAKRFADIIQKLKNNGSERDYIVLITDCTLDHGNMVTVGSCQDHLYNAALCNKAAGIELKHEMENTQKSESIAKKMLDKLFPQNTKPIN